MEEMFLERGINMSYETIHW